jgi:hypothetical protein
MVDFRSIYLYWTGFGIKGGAQIQCFHWRIGESALLLTLEIDVLELCYRNGWVNFFIANIGYILQWLYLLVKALSLDGWDTWAPFVYFTVLDAEFEIQQSLKHSAVYVNLRAKTGEQNILHFSKVVKRELYSCKTRVLFQYFIYTCWKYCHRQFESKPLPFFRKLSWERITTGLLSSVS